MALVPAYSATATALNFSGLVVRCSTRRLNPPINSGAIVVLLLSTNGSFRLQLLTRVATCWKPVLLSRSWRAWGSFSRYGQTGQMSLWLAKSRWSLVVRSFEAIVTGTARSNVQIRRIFGALAIAGPAFDLRLRSPIVGNNSHMTNEWVTFSTIWIGWLGLSGRAAAPNNAGKARWTFGAKSFEGNRESTTERDTAE